MVASEPEGSMTWYPVNDHPTDKASYSFEITVPEGKVAVANGLPPRDPVTEDGWTTWYWDAPDLQASYLTTASVGDYEVRPVYYSSSGIPILDFVDDGVTGNALTTTNASLAQQAAMLDFFESIYGPYPFNSYGSIVDDDSVGYALETQTRPIYSGQANEGTVAHEAAHMWLGNAVSPGRWQDIWLNEGWATYSTWLWNDHRGHPGPDGVRQLVRARPDARVLGAADRRPGSDEPVRDPGLQPRCRHPARAAGQDR
jgi:aminopeptidase N